MAAARASAIGAGEIGQRQHAVEGRLGEAVDDRVPVGEALAIDVAVTLRSWSRSARSRTRPAAAWSGCGRSCAASVRPRRAPWHSAPKTAASAATHASIFRRRMPHRLAVLKRIETGLCVQPIHSSTSSTGSATAAGSAPISSSSRNFLTSSAACARIAGAPPRVRRASAARSGSDPRSSCACAISRAISPNIASSTPRRADEALQPVDIELRVARRPDSRSAGGCRR